MRKGTLLRIILAVALVFAVGALNSNAWAQAAGQTPINPRTLDQFIDPLPDLSIKGAASPNPVIETIVAGAGQIGLTMQEFRANVLPSTFVPAAGGAYAGTAVWGYRNTAPPAPAGTYIGPVVVATRYIPSIPQGNPTEIMFTNNLGSTQTTQVLFWGAAIDQSLHWANPAGADMYTTTNGVVTGNQLNYTGPIPAVPHLHGGEVPPWIDGGPDAWFLSNSAGWGAGYPGAWDTYTKTGPGYYTKNATDPYYTAVYRYPNVQPAAPIWFHDHLLGGTRLNVYAGIAGAYLIVDPSDSTPPNLQPVNEIVPVVIQDRMFDTNGELFFPSVGINPTLHPFWIPEFVGDTIAVNGKVWPFLNVESKRYRFLFLNGSNARAYELFLTSQGTGMKAPVMWQISTDGGYLDFPVAIDPNAKVLNKLILMPGERAGVIIDFAGFKAGDTLILANTARTPYPGGAPVSGRTTGRVMQFKVTGPPASPDTSYNPNPAVTGGGGPLRSGDPIRRLVNTATGALGVTPNKVRQLTLNEVMAPGGPYEVLVNNTKWNGKRATAMGSPVEIVSGGISDGIGNYYTENPNEGDVEVWEIINMTADAHPIHTHLTQFQLVNRQNFDLKGYSAMYNGAFPNTGTPYFDPMTSTFMAFPAGAFIPAFGSPYNYDNSNNPDYATPPTIPVVGGNPDVTPFLMGPVIPPAANEAGWKDTVQMYPGQVTRIAIPYRPINSAPNTNYAFNPGGADYVWHCHIIDHEDNEMMRPYQVTPAAVARTYIKGTDY